MAAREGKTARRTLRPWPTWRAATGAGPTASRTCARRSGWTRTRCADSSRRGRPRRRDGGTLGHRLREHEPPAARRAGAPLLGVRRRGERGPASYAVRRLNARCGAAAGPHLLRPLRDAAHHRPLTYTLAHARPPGRAAGASGSLRAETRAQRVEYVLGRAGDVVDLAIDQAHCGRAGRLPGDTDDGARTQPDVPVIGLELDEVAHDRSPSAARFATRFVATRLRAGSSSGRGCWGHCGHHAVDGSSHGARRGTDQGFANRGDGVRNGGARLPRDRVLPCPRLRARTLTRLRAGPLGVDLLGRSHRTRCAGGLLLCRRLLLLRRNGLCPWRLASCACAASLLVRLPRRHGHLLFERRARSSLRRRYERDEPSLAIFPPSHRSPGTSPATARPGCYSAVARSPYPELDSTRPALADRRLPSRFA